MSLLEELGSDVITEIQRDLLMLGSIDDKRAPACYFKVVFLRKQQIDDYVAQFPDRSTREKELSFRRYVARKHLVGWKDVTPLNLARMCEAALVRPDALSRLPEQIEFTPENRDWVVDHLDDYAWEEQFVKGCAFRDHFVREQIEREKKDSEPTSGSDSHDSPRKPAKAAPVTTH